jgi:UDP-glucose 4-epimerase
MTSKFKKVLITGGAGTIGLPLTEELISRGVEVIVFDLEEQITRLDKYINPKAKKFSGSILDSAALRDAMFDCDGVIHLAAHLGVQRTERNRLRCLDININGTQKVLDACVMSGNVKKIIYASSSEVYGEPLTNPINEKAITQGKTVYAVSKLAGEELVKAYHSEFPDLKYSILRFFNAYGPHQVSQFVISKFIHRVSQNLSPIIYGDGTQRRSYNYSKDTARGAADALFSVKTSEQILNIGNSNEPITLIDLAKKIIKLAGKEASLKVEIKNSFEETDRSQNREIFQRFCDTSKAHELIQYESTFTLDKGIKEIMEVGSFHSTWNTSEKNYLID